MLLRLRDLYRQLLKESPKHMDGLALHTAPQIRKRLGRLPPGGEEDDMIFGTLRGGTTDFVLLLQTVGTGWRVVGLNR